MRRICPVELASDARFHETRGKMGRMFDRTVCSVRCALSRATFRSRSTMSLRIDHRLRQADPLPLEPRPLRKRSISMSRKKYHSVFFNLGGEGSETGSAVCWPSYKPMISSANFIKRSPSASFDARSHSSRILAHNDGSTSLVELADRQKIDKRGKSDIPTRGVPASAPKNIVGSFVRIPS